MSLSPFDPTLTSVGPRRIGPWDDTDPDDSRETCHWRGIGTTAFLGVRGAASAAEPAERPDVRWVATAQQLADEYDDRTSDGIRRVVEAYFSGGGRGGYVTLETSQPGSELRQGGAVREGGRPHAGLHALVDDEAVGIIVLCEPQFFRAPEWIFSLAARREDLFFLFESDVTTVEFLRPNVATVRGAGDLAAVLEDLDFRSDGIPREPTAEELSRWGGDCLLTLMAWRQREGLRRSIDWGTRWLLFELHHPRIWRRAEREVRAFLYRMSTLGLLDERRPAGRFEVYCLPRPPVRRGSGEVAEPAANVALRVRAPLRREFEEALRRTTEALKAPDRGGAGARDSGGRAGAREGLGRSGL